MHFLTNTCQLFIANDAHALKFYLFFLLILGPFIKNLCCLLTLLTQRGKNSKGRKVGEAEVAGGEVEVRDVGRNGLVQIG